MASESNVVLVNADFSDRASTLTSELQFAIRQIDSAQMRIWTEDVLRTTAHVGTRRVVRFGKTVIGFGEALFEEGRKGVEAAGRGEFLEHAKQRGQEASETIRVGVSRVMEQGSNAAKAFQSPERLPEAVVTIVAALVTSGGIDADGGLPDLDLQLGIGAHRSIFTHSIIAGTVVESSLYAVATLMGIAHSRLPTKHDDLWDNINKHKDEITAAITRGMSAGLAYHLMVDGLVQEGAYHGLPIAMPQGAHDAIAAGNGLMEARDIDAKDETFLRTRIPKRRQ